MNLKVFLSLVHLVCWSLARPPTKHEKRDSSPQIPPTPASVAPIGLTTDASFNPNIRRDGGGGGYVNGYHIAGFSDTLTVTNPDGDLESFSSFTHNSFTYMGYPQMNATELYDFGTNRSSGAGTFPDSVVRPLPGNESNNAQFAIWSTSNYISSADDKQAIGVMNCLREGTVNLADPKSKGYYNTLVAIDVVDPITILDGQTLEGHRLVTQLFYGSEIMYGSFGLFKADQYVYLFDSSEITPSGLFAARVPFTGIADRSQYTYWDGFAWSSTPPARTDVSAHIFNFTNPSNPSLTVGSGDLFYSPHFQRHLAIFQDDGIDGQFWVTYSLGDSIVGPWSEPQTFFTPVIGDEPCQGNDWSNWNYAGHAYPDWDESGRTLLLTWSSCASYVKAATVQWT